MKKLALSLILSIILSTITIKPVDATSCKDYHIIFARGSGQELNGPDWQSFSKAFKKYFQSAEYYELGSRKQAGFQYPAVSIGNLNTLLGAKISAGKSFSYGKSVKQGIYELENYIKNISLTCPDTKFILGGYSQGAQVVSSALPKLPAGKIAYTATFGDPKLYLPEGYSKTTALPIACFRKNLSNYRVNVPDCEVYEGILTASIPYQPAKYKDKLGAWCNIGDIICGSYLVSNINIMAGHSYYRTDGSHEHAARIAYKVTHQDDEEIENKHDVALLIDVSMSMEIYIEEYRPFARRLAREVINNGGRIALFTYNDLETASPAILCDFSCTISDFDNATSYLPVSGGGDDEESAVSASLFAMNNLKWQKGATKTMVLLTDAGFHNPDRDGVTLEQVIRRSWEIDPVNFYFITEEVDDYADWATQTGGRVFNMDSEMSIATTAIALKNEELITPPYAYNSERKTASISLLTKSFQDDSLKLEVSPSEYFNIMSVAVNDTLIGFTKETSLKIEGIDESSTITLTPFSTTGHKGQPLIISQKTASSISSSTHLTPKAPNTGQK